MKRTALAKLTRPHLHKALARERLFALLDARRHNRCIWIAAPPGAGKTTLIASYLAARGLAASWHQIDSGDSDPATFFYYLREAVCTHLPRASRPPPLLTPEYLRDLAGFARRFMRRSLSLVDGEFILVFDNYHELPADSPVHAALAAALEEVRDGCTVVVVSRADPPAAFARALINRTLVRVDWEDLRLTLDETTDIVRSFDAALLARAEWLHAQSSGWMAGVVLMSEGMQRAGDLLDVAGSATLETLFDYFAGQIFEALPAQCREVLIRTALLPHVNGPLALLATGMPDAIGHIEQMHRRRLFTDRLPGSEPGYRYHALFRAFLMSKARAQLPRPALRELGRRAALEVEGSGDREGAFALAVDAEEWLEAERLFQAHAATLIGQGRWQTLREWSLVSEAAGRTAADRTGARHRAARGPYPHPRGPPDAAAACRRALALAGEDLHPGALRDPARRSAAHLFAQGAETRAHAAAGDRRAGRHGVGRGTHHRSAVAGP